MFCDNGTVCGFYFQLEFDASRLYAEERGDEDLEEAHKLYELKLAAVKTRITDWERKHQELVENIDIYLRLSFNTSMIFTEICTAVKCFF